MNCRLEVVAICDHLIAFGAAGLEDKIGGKAPSVALNLLVQLLGASFCASIMPRGGAQGIARYSSSRAAFATAL